MKKRIRKYFLSGLMVVVPISLTVYILWAIIKFTDRLYPSSFLPFYVPGFGIVITFVTIFLVGLITTNILGRRLLSLGEYSYIPCSFGEGDLSLNKTDCRSAFFTKRKKLQKSGAD